MYHAAIHWRASQVEELRQQYPNLVVWTSTLQRTIQTAQYIPLGKTQIKQLDEIAAGGGLAMTVAYGSTVVGFRLRWHDV
jgi:hypothetical protein